MTTNDNKRQQNNRVLSGELVKDNPFTVSFGEEPFTIIKRDDVVEPIISSFQSANPLSRTFVISGPRGSGKTVILNEISKSLSKEKDWIIADLNPYRDMLEQLAAALFEKGKTKHLFLKDEFGFSFYGISVSISGDKPVSDVVSMLHKMLSYILEKGKKVLITIDDVSNQKELKEFIHSFQSFAREKFPIYLLMTGLNENIGIIENNKSLTFLMRAPKIYLSPLSLISIAHSYEYLLKVSAEESIKLAKLTNGFAYAYQLLGSLLFNEPERKITKKILYAYDETLESNVYQKIFDNLSECKKLFLLAMVGKSKTKISDIISSSGMKNNMVQVYKKRLEKDGIIISNEHGAVSFSLPRFAEFIKCQKIVDNE